MRKLQIIGVIVFCILVSGCSKSTRMISDKIVSDGKGPDVMIEQEYKIGNSQIYKMNETFKKPDPTIEDPQNIGLECTIKNAVIYGTPSEAGIKKDQLYRAENYKLGDQSQIEIKSVDEIYKDKILICDFNIKNINTDVLNITFLSLVYVASNNNVEMVGRPVYFSESQYLKSGEGKYFDYSLLKGKDQDVKLGWSINWEEVPVDNLYLCTNYGGDEELTIYIPLEL